MSWKFNLGLPLLGRTKLRNPEFDRQRIAKTWFIIGSSKRRKYWQASIKTGNTVGKMLNHMNSSIKVITLNLMRCASHLTKTSSSIFFQILILQMYIMWNCSVYIVVVLPVCQMCWTCLQLKTIWASDMILTKFSFGNGTNLHNLFAYHLTNFLRPLHKLNVFLPHCIIVTMTKKQLFHQIIHLKKVNRFFNFNIWSVSTYFGSDSKEYSK